MSTETIRLIRDGENRGLEEGGGGRVWRGGGERGIIHVSLHCYRQKDSCIKMGGDEIHFNTSLIVRDNSSVHRPHNLLKRKQSRSGFKPMSFRLPA